MNPRHLPLARLCFIVALLLVVGVSVRRPTAQGDPPGSPSTDMTDRTDRFDVIVVGSEPEGVTAAVAAAEEGARTLLVSRDARLGGLFVMGEMNSLDLRTQPERYQRGLFERWWQQVGRRASFDVERAEAVFVAMLANANVYVRLGAADIAPLIEGGALTGVVIDGTPYPARQVIDATAEADFAAAAGAPFTVGFASLGLEARMVDTLVFRIDGVDWGALQRGVRLRGGKSYAEINDWAAWGHFGGYPARYEATEPGIRLRGLNLGRQEDGTVLVNALLIHGIDPFDEASLAQGYARAEREAPRIIAYLKADLPGFAHARYGGVAESLYIRESRHLEARCTLTVDDTLDNVVTDQDVVAGGYPLDVQALTPYDTGYVFGTPEVYGAQLCVSVPARGPALWVVGKAAGYDPIAASSARVVPFGMALGEAVGVAAARAGESTPHDIVADPATIAALRERLLARGAYLARVTPRSPSGPYWHPFWDAYRVLLRRGLALGGYSNSPELDREMTALSFLYLLSNVAQRYHNDPALGQTLVTRYGMLEGPLTADLAARIVADAACELGRCLEADWAALRQNNLAPEDFPPASSFTRGQGYALAARLATLGEDTTAILTPDPTMQFSDD